MTEWNTEPPVLAKSWRKMPVGSVMNMPKAKIEKLMREFPGQFSWAEPDLLKRIAPSEANKDRLLSTIYRRPEGITLGILINRFRHYTPEAVTKMAAKLEADGHVRSVSSVHKYNKRQTITYYPA